MNESLEKKIDWRSDDSNETYKTNNQIKFKSTVLKFSLCDYSDAYILVKGTITAPNTVVANAVGKKSNI